MKRLMVALFVMIGIFLPLTSAGPAQAAGQWQGWWQGSLAYVYWGDGCDEPGAGIDFPSQSMNINFSGGPRDGGRTYVYDFHVVNGTAATEMTFPQGVRVGANNVYKTVYPTRLNAGESQRFIVDFEVPARIVVADFFPMTGTRGCNNTQAFVSW